MKALAARAMLKNDSGDWSGARSDMMVVGRWARLMSQPPHLIGRLVGLAEDAKRVNTITALIIDAQMTEPQATALLTDMDSLPPLPDMREAIANERFLALDSVMLLARGKLALPVKSDDDDIDPLRESLVFFAQVAEIGNVDWNITLRIINKWYGKMEAVAAEKTVRERNVADDTYQSGQEKISAELLKLRPLIESLLDKTDKTSPKKRTAAIDPKVLSDAIGKMIAITFVPSLHRAGTLQEQHAMNHELARVGLALAAMRARTGKFPARLARLSPKYLKSIPKDTFSGKPLIYKRTRRGYLLYSIGRNLKDDGGVDDMNKGDLVIRVE